MADADLSPPQKALLEFLRSKSGKTVTREEILAATKWKPATFQAYLSKGHFDSLLREEDDGSLLVKAAADLDEWTFKRSLTQSGSAREVGAPCKNDLARALVRKARDNMTLALELYNRPTLENRLDAFCMLFCTAWEQLLKAEIIEEEGEDLIYTRQEPGERPKTISLDKALEKRFASNDLVKANIAQIADLRHGATHLLMPEVQSVLSRIFQAGVLNFTKRFSVLGGMPLFPPSASGLLSLIGDPQSTDMQALRHSYGTRTGSAIIGLIESLEKVIESTDDPHFAISIDYKLVLTKSESKADVRLTTSQSGPTTALIVEKPVAVERTHPFSLKDVIRQLSERLQRADLNAHSIAAAVFKEGWKRENNDYHFHFKRANLHYYSERAIVELAAKLKSDNGYLRSAIEAYTKHHREQQKGKAQSHR